MQRSQSMTLVPRSEPSGPRSFVTRYRSIPDFTRHVRGSYKYKPHWTQNWNNYRRDYDLHDAYWFDRYFYYSPLSWPRQFPGRRYSYSDYVTNPYYWYYPTNEQLNWPSKGLWYNYAYSGYHHRYLDTSYDRYFTNPYRSWVLDSMSDSVDRGLQMYRTGLINYNVLDRYWLTNSYWDRRFKSWRDLYTWDHKVAPTDFKAADTPGFWNRRSAHYYYCLY